MPGCVGKEADVKEILQEEQAEAVSAGPLSPGAATEEQAPELAPELAPERPLSQHPESRDARAQGTAPGAAPAGLVSGEQLSGRAADPESRGAALEHGAQSQGIAGRAIL